MDQPKLSADEKKLAGDLYRPNGPGLHVTEDDPAPTWGLANTGGRIHRL
jgi:hypothetical protein